MKFKKKCLASVISLTAIAGSTAIVVPLVLASKNVSPVSPITPVQKKIFNIKGDTVYGFNDSVTSKDVEQYIKDNNGLLLPSVKKIAPFAFEQFNTKLGLQLKDIPLPIPATIEEIPEHAFYASDITALTFETGSKCHTIGKSAFAFCHNLESAEFPQGVLTNDPESKGYGIKDRAFFLCDKLTKLDFSKVTLATPSGKQTQFAWAEDVFIGLPTDGKILYNVTSKQETLYKSGVLWTRLILSALGKAWVQCKSDETAVSNPCKPLPNEAYKLDESGEQITLINYDQYWVSGAEKWYGVFNMTIIPSEITAVDFSDYTKGQYNFFPELCRDYEVLVHTFEYCDKLQSLQHGVFKNLNTEDRELPTITLPPKITKIDDSLFAADSMTGNDEEPINKLNIKGLNNLLGPKGTVTEIEYAAFQNCQSKDLENLTFKKDIKVDWHAFKNCQSIKNINLAANGITPPADGLWDTTCFANLPEAKRTVTIGQDSKKNLLEQYRISKVWLPWFTAHGMEIKDEKWTIKPKGYPLQYEDLFNIDKNGVCKGWITDNSGKIPTADEFTELLGDINSLTMPSTVTQIADNAFVVVDSKGNLVSTIPPNIQNINLSGSNVTNIGKNAFASLPATCTTVTFSETDKPSKIQIIGEGAFQNGAFATINGLTDCSTITEIGKKAFYHCHRVGTCSKDGDTEGLLLDNMTSLTTIGDDAFSRWDSMHSVDKAKTLRLNPQLTSIGRNAFYAHKYTTIVIPKFDLKVTIGANAFAQDSTVKNNLLKTIDMAENTAPPAWLRESGMYLFAGVATSGTIIVNEQTTDENMALIWWYFTKQSEEIKRNKWEVIKDI